MHQGLNQIQACTEADIYEYRGSPQELEANAFAGSFLMPRKLAGRHVAGRDPFLQTISELSSAFSVSITAAIRRFLDLTLVPCVAVFSDGENVRWTWKSANLGDEYLRLDPELDPACTAYQCDNDLDEAIRIGPIPGEANAWFPTNFNVESIVVTEQSAALYPGMTVTVLKLGFG